jgi:hypothetical protein
MRRHPGSGGLAVHPAMMIPFATHDRSQRFARRSREYCGPRITKIGLSSLIADEK